VKLHVELAARDLGAVRFAISPIQHLIQGLQARSDPARRWYRGISRRLPGTAQPLLDLVNNHWYVPDFISPPIPLDRDYRRLLDDELDVVAATTAAQVEFELRWCGTPRNTPRSVLELLDGGSKARTRLTRSVHRVYDACLADDWPDMVRRLHADIAARAAHMARSGVAATMAGLDPSLHNVGELQFTLEIPAAGTWPDYRFTSAGQGLLLAPNLFQEGRIGAYISPWQVPILSYPAMRAERQAAAADEGRDALTVLLGRGRAAALRAIASGCSTRELAARLNVSSPSASAQAAVLREAGLIATLRDGRRVQHTPTALGARLLEANPKR
jgi:DNA-binding transcriptional ArsR family regulator